MSPIIVDKKQKKEHILDAALGVFVNKGFSNVVINDIAKVAGIGKGTVYEYFKSKEDLFSELLIHLFARHKNYIPKQWENGTTPEKKLRNLLSSFLYPSLHSGFLKTE